MGRPRSKSTISPDSDERRKAGEGSFKFFLPQFNPNIVYSCFLTFHLSILLNNINIKIQLTTSCYVDQLAR